jgi:hypothetical protein
VKKILAPALRRDLPSLLRFRVIEAVQPVVDIPCGITLIDSTGIAPAEAWISRARLGWSNWNTAHWSARLENGVSG